MLVSLEMRVLSGGSSVRTIREVLAPDFGEIRHQFRMSDTAKSIRVSQVSKQQTEREEG